MSCTRVERRGVHGAGGIEPVPDYSDCLIGLDDNRLSPSRRGLFTGVVVARFLDPQRQIEDTVSFFQEQVMEIRQLAA